MDPEREKVTAETVSSPADPHQFIEDVRQLIGCEWIEYLHCGDGLLLLVDEEGKLNGGDAKTWHFRGCKIVGSGLFVGTRDTRDATEETDCPLPAQDLANEVIFY